MNEEFETTTIHLKRPVKHNGATYDAITIRESVMGDQIDVQNENPGAKAGDLEAALVAKVSGLPVEVVRKIRLPDYQKVQAVLMDFPYAPSAQPAAPPSSSADSQAAGA